MECFEAIRVAKTHFLEGRSEVAHQILSRVKDKECWSSPTQLSVDVALCITSSPDDAINTVDSIYLTLRSLHNLMLPVKDVHNMSFAVLHLSYELCRVQMNKSSEPNQACITAKETIDMCYSWLVRGEFMMEQVEFQGSNNDYDSPSCYLRLLWNFLHSSNGARSWEQTELIAFEVALDRLVLIWIANLVILKKFSEAKSIIIMRKRLKCPTFTASSSLNKSSDFEQIFLMNQNFGLFEFMLCSHRNEALDGLESLLSDIHETKQYIQHELLAHRLLSSVVGEYNGTRVRTHISAPSFFQSP
jgi:hypothetical protein